jgi:DNA modification methylase
LTVDEKRELAIYDNRITRACRAIEIEPQYVQVTIDRWEAFTGQRAVKVGDARS